MKYFRQDREQEYFMPKFKAKVDEEAVDTHSSISGQDRIKAIKEEELVKVRGRFRNIESPGAKAPIYVRKYKGVPDFKMDMVDGQVYEVPLYVARFLNGKDAQAGAVDGIIHTCSWAESAYKMPTGSDMPIRSGTDEAGMIVPILTVGKRHQRYAFESLEFDSASKAASAFAA
jgi:hypothetical protein